MPIRDDTNTALISHDELLHESKIMHAYFTEDKKAFIAFDSIFDDPFAANWFKKIKSCMKTSNEQPCSNDNSQNMIHMKIEECRQTHMDLRCFVSIAFPHRDDLISRFGFDDYSKARKDPVKMIKLLKKLYENALKFEKELIDAGYQHDNVHKIKNLHEELISLEDQQKAYKNNVHPNRRECLNTCFAYMQLINNASKILFAEDDIKLQRYLLPFEKISGEKEKNDIRKKRILSKLTPVLSALDQ